MQLFLKRKGSRFLVFRGGDKNICLKINDKKLSYFSLTAKEEVCKKKAASPDKPAKCLNEITSNEVISKLLKLAALRQFIPFSPQAIAPFGCVEREEKKHNAFKGIERLRPQGINKIANT